MYIFALFMTFAMALIGVGGLELALTYEHGTAARTAGKLADQYMAQAEQTYATAFVQQGTSSETVTGVSLCPQGGMTNAATGATQACGYTADYTVTTTGSTGGAPTATGITSAGVNSAAGINEQRIGAVLTMKVKNSSGVLLATRTRTFIFRTYNGLAPYASIISSTDTQDVYQTAGTAHSALSEGDSTCDGLSNCGDDTRIRSFAACNLSGSPNPAQQQMQQSWCGSPPPGAYDSSGTPNTGGTWYTVETTKATSATWQNGNASSGGSN